ncbi:TPA: hypothetical protein SAP38_003367 [Escherichia coli]|nr:hypothetical protein [Escherichia coli]
MIIFTLRRILLLIVTLFLLTFVGFSLSYFTPHAPLQGASLWNAWVFWFNGLIHWDFGVSSINGQPIAEQLKEVFPATMELCILAFGFALIVGIPVGMIAGITRHKWQDNLINAIRQQDYAAISAGVMVCGSLVIIVNVISDILGAMANPLKHKEWYALR